MRRSPQVDVYRATMDERGGLLLPAEPGARSSMTVGSVLILLDTPDGIVMLTPEQLRARVRTDLAGTDLVGELLADRRADAAYEDYA